MESHREGLCEAAYDRWQAGHLDDADPYSSIAPEARSWNAAAGARMGNALRNGKPAPAPVPDFTQAEIDNATWFERAPHSWELVAADRRRDPVERIASVVRWQAGVLYIEHETSVVF